MPTGARSIVAVVWEKSGWAIVARVYDLAAGALVTTATFASPGGITYRLYQMDGNTARELTSSATALTVGDVVYDTLQTNSIIWPVDSTGYNFKWTVPDTLIKRAGKHKIEIWLQPQSGSGFPLVVELDAKPLISR